MMTPVEVRALPAYRIYVRYSDGAAGEVDLSEYAGRGVFAAWRDRELFEAVHVGEHRQIRWNDDIELCPDAIYMRLTGKSPQEYFSTSPVAAHA